MNQPDVSEIGGSHKTAFVSSTNDDNDDDKKFNTDMLLDVRAWRQEQKERKRKEEELAAIEADKAEKKRKAKS